jgi:transposase
MAYSDDLRQKLLQAVASQPVSKATLARTFGVSVSYLKGIVRRQKAGNSHALPHAGGVPRRLNAMQQEQLRQQVLAHPEQLLRELCDWLQAICQVQVSVSALCRLLQHMKLPRKKRHSTPPSATRPLTHRNVNNGALRSSYSTPTSLSLSMKAE